jgi:hypothetical protein
MSFVLKQNGNQIAIAGAWNPVLFSNHTGTSFPKEVGNEYVWTENGFDLRWEADPAPTPPTPSEIQQREQEQINERSRQYLLDTDWYVVRFIETGVVVPSDILTARQTARDAIVELA